MMLLFNITMRRSAALMGIRLHHAAQPPLTKPIERRHRSLACQFPELLDGFIHDSHFHQVSLLSPEEINSNGALLPGKSLLPTMKVVD